MKVSWTISGARQLGRMCRQMIQPCRAPQARAACTYSISRTTSTATRTMRAVRGV